MNVQSIVTLARALSWNVSTNMVSDTEIVSFFNKAYKGFYNKIVRLDRNYFWDSWKTSTVANQFEYDLKKPSDGSYGIFKPEKIRIKYASTGEYKDVEFKDWDSLIETPEFYAENQSVDSPFAIMTDTRYFHIFPTPTVAVSDWLIVEGAKKPYDLTISDGESEILIDPQYHETIAYLICPLIEKKRANIDGKNDAINEADKEVNESLKSMWLLTTKVVRAKIADLSWLE